MSPFQRAPECLENDIEVQDEKVWVVIQGTH